MSNFTYTSTPPSTIAAAALASSGPAVAAPAALTVTAAQVQATAFSTGSTTASLPTMASSFTPAFVELTGAGNTLSTLNASVATDIGKILQGTVGGVLKSYQVRAGTDAQVVPGIIHPANYDPVLNACVFVEC